MRPLANLVPGSVLALLLADLILVTFCYLAIVLVSLEVSPEVWLLYDDGLARTGILVVAVLISMHFQDLYSDLRVDSATRMVPQAAMVVGLAFLFQAVVSWGAPGLRFPRRAMMGGSGLLLIALPLWRYAYSQFVVRALAAERVLFLGANAVAQAIAGEISRRPELGLQVAGFVIDPAANAAGAPPPDKVLGSIEDFRAIVDHTRPDRIIIGMSERRQRLPVLDLLDYNFAGIRVEDAATAFEAVFRRVATEELRPSQLIFTQELGPSPGTVKLQAAYSWTLALVGLILTFPLMILVALLIKLTSRGPVLYRQQRVGRNGCLFTLYKFRSMRADAEIDTGAVWASPDDPRITPLGRWLRRLRLDELPQFINILRGDMCLVGPRPERPEFVSVLSRKIPFYRQRLCIKPGITGWAQINHKYGDSIEDTIVKLEYDLYYIKNLSLRLDAYIMFQTIKVIVLSRGAQ
jgi:sugar transferase (PEP-CTERM system associated)